jgi:hypothetical protein
MDLFNRLESLLSCACTLAACPSGLMGLNSSPPMRGDAFGIGWFGLIVGGIGASGLLGGGSSENLSTSSLSDLAVIYCGGVKLVYFYSHFRQIITTILLK